MSKTLEALETPLRPDMRLVLAWMEAKAEAEEGIYPRSEAEIAACMGTSPHKVRQAIAGLRRLGHVRREFYTGLGTPVAVYGPDREWVQA